MYTTVRYNAKSSTIGSRAVSMKGLKMAVQVAFITASPYLIYYLLSVTGGKYAKESVLWWSSALSYSVQ